MFIINLRLVWELKVGGRWGVWNLLNLQYADIYSPGAIQCNNDAELAKTIKTNYTWRDNWHWLKCYVHGNTSSLHNRW